MTLGAQDFAYKVTHKIRTFDMFTRKKAAITLLLNIFSFSPGLLAKQESNGLDELVVTSQYRATEKTPVSYQNISLETLDSINFGQEPSFILQRTPSITVYSDSGGYQGYSYFRLRGIDQTRINMTLDGVPLNEPEDQGVYFSNYPDFFSSIDGLQIQRGVGTTKNGTASYAGSIEFSSPNLSDDSQSLLEIGAGSFGSQRVMGEYKSGIYDNKAFYLRASGISSDGYKHRSENKSNSAFFSGGINKEISSWKLTGFIGEQKNQLAWLGVSEEEINRDRRTNGNAEEDDEFSQALLILKQDRDVGEFSKSSSSIYYNTLEGNYDFDLNNFLGFPSTGEIFNYALESSFAGFFSNFSYNKNNLDLTVGLHINQYSREHIGSETNLGQLYENTGYRDSVSVFAKILYESGRATWFADLESRDTDFDYRGSVPIDKMKWSFFNPKIGVNIEANKGLDIYYSVGRTGREPTRTDIFGGNDNLEVGADRLPLLFITEPEYVIDHELGARFSSDKLRFDINYYYMDFEDEIVLNGQFGPNGLALNNDVDSSIRSGIEVISDIRLNSSLSLHTAASFSKSEIQDSGLKFEHVLSPEQILFQELLYKESEVEIGISWRYQSDSYLDFGNSEKLDSFSAVNLRFQYETENWKYQLYANNILDNKYFNNGLVDFDGVPKYFVGPPANYHLTIGYIF